MSNYTVINVENNKMNILVTGSAGFIGANLVLRLLDSSEPLHIVGLDNMNSYYDPSLKEYRLRQIEEKAKAVETCEVKVPELVEGPTIEKPTQTPCSSWTFIQGSISDRELVNQLFKDFHFDIVVNLAAQAGVRYSIENPDAYIESNIIGFYNILEACRHYPVQHLVYASSSSVYGGNTKIPFSVEDRVDNPVSLYAATKKSNELFAHCYSKLYDIPTTGLRFFTVYGPAGRPSVSPTSFSKARPSRSSTTATAAAISPT